MKFTILVYEIERNLIRQAKKEVEKFKKNKMKKGVYWFSFLSEKEQKEYRINCEHGDEDFHKIMDEEFSCFNYFIAQGFWWDETPQGNDYWAEISERHKDEKI